MTSPAFPTTRRHQRAALVIGAFIAAVALLGPVLQDPAGLALGAPDSEAAQQLWLTTAWTRDLAETGPWLRAPHPYRIDPVLMNVRPATVVVAWPIFEVLGGGLAAAALSWNAWWLLALLAATWGTWQIIEQVYPATRRSGSAIPLALVVAFGAYLHAHPWTGRIETLSLFVYPAHLALLLKAGLGPTGRVRRLWALAAVGSFGLLALQGGFPGMFVGLVEVPVGVWLWRRASDRPWVTALLVATAAAGVAAIAPWILAVSKEPPPTLTRGTSDVVVVGLRQLLPGGSALHYSSGRHTSPYPGLVLLLAAVAASWRHREGRPWLAMALAAIFLSLGPELRWTPDGHTLAWSPLAWTARIPGWPVKLSGWYRLGALVPPLLALAAAPALARRPQRAWLVALLAIADQQAYVRTPDRPRPVIDLRPPAGLAERMTGHPVLLLPDDNLARLWEQTIPAQELAHPPAKLGVPTPVFDWLRCALPGEAPAFRVNHAPCGPPPSSRDMRQELLGYAEHGFSDVVLLPGSFQSPTQHARVRSLLTDALGQPTTLSEGVDAWSLAP